MKDLAGKTAVITGGASGIGLALAHRLAAEKMKLVLVDIEQGPLDAAAKGLSTAGAEVLALRADVSKAADMERVASETFARFGTAHVIVNNAGVGGGTGPTWKLTESDWDWSLNVNLKGVIHGIRLFVPRLVDSGEEGHVVNTASMAGLTATPWLAPYTAAKHAVVALSECLEKDLRLANTKVGVSVLCPGFVKTNIHLSERNRPSELKGSPGAPSLDQNLGSVFKTLVESGKPVEHVADAVVAAIKEPRFYILTHPEMKPAIEHRFRDILEERPPGIDPLFRSLLAGKSES
jgi:NAD(P)-dependent dehydrogenase (short-subunit alcohol dehydrogenase family)